MTRIALRCLTLVAAAAAAGCAPGPERPGGLGMGPFRIRQTSPFEFTKADVAPRMPGALRKGEAELSELVTWTSRWAYAGDHKYFADGEAVWMTTVASFGLSDRVELTLELPAAWHGGGGLDGLISAFHDLFGVRQNRRDDYSENGFRFHLYHEDDATYWIADSDEKGGFFEDPFVRLSLLAVEGAGRAPRVSLDLMLRLGGGRAEEFLEDPGPELAVGLTVAESWGDWLLYAGVARAFVAAEEFGGVELAGARTEGFAAVEWRFAEGRSAVVQWLFSSGFAEDYHVYAREAHEIHAGVKWAAGPRTTLELALIENFINFDNSPDIGFHFGATRRF